MLAAAKWLFLSCFVTLVALQSIGPDDVNFGPRNEAQGE
jgi:hypothetical protein